MKIALIIIGTGLIITAIIITYGIRCVIKSIYIDIDFDYDMDTLSTWRKELKKGEKVSVDGCTYEIEAVEGRVALVTNYSDQIFVLVADCYPVK